MDDKEKIDIDPNLNKKDLNENENENKDKHIKPESESWLKELTTQNLLLMETSNQDQKLLMEIMTEIRDTLLTILTELSLSNRKREQIIAESITDNTLNAAADAPQEVEIIKPEAEIAELELIKPETVKRRKFL